MATELSLTATYIGGPTALIEVAGLRFLTDPTFDPAGSSYDTPVYTLRKTQGPSLGVVALPPIDAVLLSHDHHFDNLDRAGRELLPRARCIFCPHAAAERLGGRAIALGAWESAETETPSGRRLRITGTPARHGPAGGDRGPVSGFLITDASIELSSASPAVYVSGDTVWYDGIEQIARRADISVAFLFMGAARVREVGPQHLTLTADEGVLVARAMPGATIVPLHYEGWQHFSEGRPVIDQAFAENGMADRVRWLVPGKPTLLP